MENLNLKLPDSTKILFLLDILNRHGKKELFKDICNIYTFIKDIGRNGIKFNYIKFYDFKKENGLYNSILNKDIMDLNRNRLIKFNNGHIIELTNSGQKLVAYFKREYETPYKHFEKLICSSPIFKG